MYTPGRYLSNRVSATHGRAWSRTSVLRVQAVQPSSPSPQSCFRSGQHVRAAPVSYALFNDQWGRRFRSPLPSIFGQPHRSFEHGSRFRAFVFSAAGGGLMAIPFVLVLLLMDAHDLSPVEADTHIPDGWVECHTGGLHGRLHWRFPEVTATTTIPGYITMAWREVYGDSLVRAEFADECTGYAVHRRPTLPKPVTITSIEGTSSLPFFHHAEREIEVPFPALKGLRDSWHFSTLSVSQRRRPPLFPEGLGALAS